MEIQMNEEQKNEEQKNIRAMAIMAGKIASSGFPIPNAERTAKDRALYSQLRMGCLIKLINDKPKGLSEEKCEELLTATKLAYTKHIRSFKNMRPKAVPYTVEEMNKKVPTAFTTYQDRKDTKGATDDEISEATGGFNF